jgi:hypothetical protein
MEKRSCEKSVRHETLNLRRTTLTRRCRVRYFKLDKFSPHVCFIFKKILSSHVWFHFGTSEYSIMKFIPAICPAKTIRHDVITLKYSVENEFSGRRLYVILQFISPYSVLVPFLFLTTLLSDILNIFCSEESDISFTSIIVKR